ncbi:hypothetical protein SteCoe_8074 [Stentor coeruleus]|uniref:Uncharacterized protein n=1 Tax=Stentor coeruleus TaxID=5963 RepID=A0A1R2CL17_9CILI|nr:hypothetical protein SteCoe_8074 [Stentor coeruleus]
MGCLPEDYALKLIDQEMMLENNCRMSVLNGLVELYRIGIEYYEDIKDLKYLEMQKRLQKILIRPQVLQIMIEENFKYKNTESKTRTKSINLTPSVQEKKQRFEKNKKELNMKLEDTNAYQIANKEKTATKTVENQIEKTEFVINKAKEDLKSQDLTLEKRIMQRKKMINVSVEDESGLNIIKEHSADLGVYEDKWAGLDIEKTVELEKVIEGIIEESFREKTEKVSEIKVKYETQINEFAGYGKMYTSIINDIKNKMQEEIDEVVQDLELRRKIALADAKAQYKVFL